MSVVHNIFPSPSTPGQGPHRGVARADDHHLLPEERKTVIDGATPTPPERERPRVAGYEVLGELGRGGMGVVYQARHLALNRVVALKMLLSGPQSAETERERFRAEAEAVARLQHPNIVQVYEVGEHEGRPYFSLEFCPGGSLADHLAAKPQPPHDAAELVETLARAMHHAHEQGIVHRDLKPANVLLSSPLPLAGEGPGVKGVTPKVTDFGLAKQLDQPHGQTHTGTVLGTPPYMAPEQARGRSREIGPATDVYSLGAILYEGLTGRPPFEGDGVAATLHQVLHDDPVPPSRLRPGVPRDLETVCLKCLQKDSRRRYATALELADDLRRFLDGEAVAARPVPRWEQARRWARRHPVAALGVLTGLAAVLALVVLTVVSYTLYQAALRNALAKEAEARSLQARSEGMTLLADARHLFDEEMWEDACLQAGQALAVFGDRPDLADLTAQAADLLAEARRRLEDETLKTKTWTTFARFLGQRDEALFHGLVTVGDDRDDSLARARDAAREALELYGVDKDFVGPLRLDLPNLDERSREQVTTGCYELLVVMAGALAQPLPGEAEADRMVRLDEAMQALDRAARIGRPPTPAYHLRRARLLELLGRDAEAENERNQAAALQSVTAIDHFLAGDEHRARGDLTRAAREFEDALRLEPGHFWAQYALAWCHLRLGRWREAKVGLTACLGHRPAFAWLYPLHGLVNAELGDFAAAEADLDRALHLDPDDATRYAVHANRGVLRFRQAEALDQRTLERAALLDPFARPTLGVMRVCRLTYLTEAADELQLAMELRPRAAQAHASLALVWARMGRTRDARAEFDAAVELGPNLPELYRSRAEFHAQHRELDAALEDLRKARKLEHNEAFLAEDHVRIGRLLQQQGKNDVAVEAYKAAREYQPDHPTALRLGALALLELRRYEDAAACLDRYLEMVNKGTRPAEPPTAVADAHKLRGLTRAQLGDYGGALHDHTRALDIQPDAATFVHRGWVYLIQGASTAAFRDFESALKLEPASGEAMVGRAQARQKMGQLREAAQDAETGLKWGPVTTRLLLVAAEVFAQIGADGDGRAKSTAEQRRAWTQRGVALVAAAVAKVPADQRARFWQEQVLTDRDLEPLRRLAEFQQIAPKANR